MTAPESIIWNKIQNFQLDDPLAKYKFSDRVARENGWPKQYALDVIEEYRKFIFLCYIPGTGITPSDPVDQVWHLHLTYTKSYWTDLCKNILDKEIHHNPTRGGTSEANKFDEFYSNTRKKYIEVFNAEPPVNIWQQNDIRFSDIDFQRANLKRFWLLKKPGRSLRKKGLLILLVFIAAISIQASDTAIITGIVAVCAVIAIASAIKNNGNGGGGGSGTNGCSGCGSGGHHGHGDSGCGSGCSGCSGSGCSGCGGGGD